MPPRDKEKTARNKLIEQMGADLKARLPRVLEITGIESEGSLHGIYGGKYADFIDLKNAVINTPDHFVTLYFRGYMAKLKKLGPWASQNVLYENFQHLQNHREVYEYVELFLKR